MDELQGGGGGGADVYAVDTNTKGVWEVTNVLDAAYSNDAAGEFEAHTLSIEVQDIPGVLNQVTGVFARRGYNVQSLAVGNSEQEGMSRICMVVPGSESGVNNLIKQLNKLVFVQQVRCGVGWGLWFVNETPGWGTSGHVLEVNMYHCLCMTHVHSPTLDTPTCGNPLLYKPPTGTHNPFFITHCHPTHTPR